MESLPSLDPLDSPSIVTMSNVPPSTANQVSSPPPILQIAPILSRFFSTALSTLRLLFLSVRALSPLPLFLYVLAPFLVFSATLIDLLVWSPLRIITNILTVLYPVYVFVGVALISGAILGVSGRFLTRALTTIVIADSRSSRSRERPGLARKFELS